MARDVSSFEKALYQNIPIAKQMGARAKSVSSDAVVLEAPLAPNTNHKSTAFGGSVYSIAVLSAWSLVSETVRAAGLESEYIVIQDGEMDYVLPVESEFVAEATWPSKEDREKFLKTLAKRGLARATLHAEVKAGGKTRARLKARFAAQLVSGPSKQSKGRA